MQRAIRLSPGRLRSSENNEYVSNVMRIEAMDIVVSTKLRYDSKSSSPNTMGFLKESNDHKLEMSNAPSDLQRLTKRLVRGCENFVLALA